MALLGIGGFESDENWSTPQINFPEIDTNRSYYINWGKALFYLIPHIPFHKTRTQIIEMMKKDEPRMI